MVREMTSKEFEESIKSQGVPIEKVTFRCPQCKTLQCGEDLIDAGAGSDFDAVEKYLAFSCVGRFNSEKGCDWTLGGLFQLHELVVVDNEGNRHPRFMPATKG